MTVMQDNFVTISVKKRKSRMPTGIVDFPAYAISPSYTYYGNNEEPEPDVEKAEQGSKLP